MKTVYLFFLMALGVVCVSAQDIIPIIEVQGEQDESPYLDQEVTINAKVTEYYGDYWYMQDEFGAWNGIFVYEPSLMVPANPPWWNEPRQPEVGDELTITGTVVELDGNTQLADVSLVEQTEFWLATPAGTEVDIAGTQDESLEGTRVRIYGVTCTSPINVDHEWIVDDGVNEMTLIGSDGVVIPEVGAVYNVYGAMREFNGVYKMDVGYIEVVSVGIEESESSFVSIWPNPMEETCNIEFSEQIVAIELYAMTGELIYREACTDTAFELHRNDLSSGMYFLRIKGEKNDSSARLIVE